MFVSNGVYVSEHALFLILPSTNFIGNTMFFLWFAEIVQKLVDRGKYVLAVKYVFEFNLADKIPPIPILKACVHASKKLATRLSLEGRPRVSVTLIYNIMHGSTSYIHRVFFADGNY